MTSMQRASNLLVCNLTLYPVRLRFRCDGRPAWDAWVAAGGEITVPEPQPAALAVSVSYVDPVAQVSYTLPYRPAAAGTHLVACVRNLAQASYFECDTQAGAAPHALELINSTAGAAHFILAFRRTPFVVQCPVRPAATARVCTGEFDLSVTLAGITSARLPIEAWRSEVEISATQWNGNEIPHLRLSTGGADQGA